jgi:hypothetical protein
MSVMASDNACADFIRVLVHPISDHRRKRPKFLATTSAGIPICISQNPYVCVADALLFEGFDLATTIAFQAADEVGDEEVMTLQEASTWTMPGYGQVLPFRKRAP